MVWPIIAAAAISAYASNRASKRAEKANLAALEAGSIQARVDEAKAAGIHPLYALGANINTPTFTSGSAAKDGLSYAADVAATGLRAYGRQKGQGATQDLARQESESRTRENISRTNYNDALTFKTWSDNARAAQAANSQQDPFTIGDPRLPAPPGIGRITTPGGDIYTSKTTSSEDVEEQYGDVAQEVYGMWRLSNDLMENALRKSKRTRKKYRGPYRTRDLGSTRGQPPIYRR